MSRKFKYWSVVTLIVCGIVCGSRVTAKADESVIRRIAFGSCANQEKPCPIWSTIADYNPEILVLLGDNVYADNLNGRMVPATPERIAAAYQTLQTDPGFARLRSSTQLMATWDDHDYGNNDAGREWIHKVESARLFHDFLGTPTDSPLREQTGVYNARTFGPEGRRVQIIMLDTRFFRSDLPKSDVPLPGWRSRPYVPQTGADAAMLGETQWRWLEAQLREPAELRLIGSSIQVISDEHPFEMWGNYPDERQRLYDLLRQTEASGVVLLSGDRHLGEISLDPQAISYPLYDITASGLNQGHQGWRLPEPNSRRLAALPYGNHFGSIEIDWEQSPVSVALQLRHEDGEIAVQTKVPLGLLTAEPAPLPRPDGVLAPRDINPVEVGEEVVVQFAVRSGRELSRPNRVLLNSDQNYQADTNFTVVLNASALPEAASAGQLSGFLNRTVRVRGKVTLYSGRKQVEVNRLEDWEILASDN